MALAFRALQEGLQPEREIERYRHYRAGIRAIRDRFDQASSPAEKFEVMQEMERLTFDEFVHLARTTRPCLPQLQSSVCVRPTVATQADLGSRTGQHLWSVEEELLALRRGQLARLRSRAKACCAAAVAAAV